MGLITEEYRELNSQLHKDRKTYGKSGYLHAKEVSDLMEKYSTLDVLDYGSGKGTLSQALGVDILEYDPCIPGKEISPRSASIVVCTDVLEHIEPDCLEDVLKHIYTIMEKACYLVISLRPAKKNLPDGRNAHLIVEKPSFWFKKLAYFNITKLKIENDTLTVWGKK